MAVLTQKTCARMSIVDCMASVGSKTEKPPACVRMASFQLVQVA